MRDMKLLFLTLIASTYFATVSAAYAADVRINLDVERECDEYRLKVVEYHAAQRKSPGGSEATSLRKELGDRGVVLMDKVVLLSQDERKLLTLLGPPAGSTEAKVREPESTVRHYYYGRLPGEYVQFHFQDGKLKRHGLVAAAADE